ncbi:MAG: putative Ig domain-containing protein [Clostridiales bacterium]|nr:putative Ig domain-containing protein [Clostridiales bacterium]
MKSFFKKSLSLLIVFLIVFSSAPKITVALAADPAIKVEAEDYYSHTGNIYIRNNGDVVPGSTAADNVTLTGASGGKFVDFSDPSTSYTTATNDAVPSGQDTASWKVTVPKAGNYELHFVYNNPATKAAGYRNVRDERNCRIVIGEKDEHFLDDDNPRWAGWMIFNISGYIDGFDPGSATSLTPQTDSNYLNVKGNKAWNSNYMIVRLDAGENVITLGIEAPPGQGVYDGPNLDYFEVAYVGDQFVDKAEIPYISDDFSFVHPGVYFTEDELANIKEQKGVSGSAYAAGYQELLTAVSWFDSNNINTVDTLDVGPYNNPNKGGTEYTRAGSKVLYYALKYFLDDDLAYGKKAIAAINDWSTKLQTLGAGNDVKLRIALVGPDFVNAAEILKYIYNKDIRVAEADKWSDADISSFEGFLRMLLTKTADYYPQANGNWDALIGGFNMAAAVFLEDTDLFNGALRQRYIGNIRDDYCVSMGSLPSYIYPSGEQQESSRDQTHSRMGLTGLAYQSEIGWNQGIDLYGAYESRLLKGTLYNAAYVTGGSVESSTFISDRNRTNSDISSMCYEILGNHYRNHLDSSGADVDLLYKAANDRLRSVNTNNEAGRKASNFGAMIFTDKAYNVSLEVSADKLAFGKAGEKVTLSASLETDSLIKGVRWSVPDSLEQYADCKISADSLTLELEFKSVPAGLDSAEITATSIKNASVSSSVTIYSDIKAPLAEKAHEVEALVQEDYSAESWAIFKPALENARKALNSSAATQAEVDKALQDLVNAENALQALPIEYLIDDAFASNFNNQGNNVMNGVKLIFGKGRHTYFKFDLSRARDTELLSAVLHYVKSHGANTLIFTECESTLQDGATPWSYSNLTYNNRPVDIAGSPTITVVDSNSSGDRPRETDLAEIFNYALANGRTTISIHLTTEAVDDTAVAASEIYSSRHTTVTGPYLEIETSSQEPPGDPTLALSKPDMGSYFSNSNVAAAIAKIKDANGAYIKMESTGSLSSGASESEASLFALYVQDYSKTAASGISEDYGATIESYAIKCLDNGKYLTFQNYFEEADTTAPYYSIISGSGKNAIYEIKASAETPNWNERFYLELRGDYCLITTHLLTYRDDPSFVKTPVRMTASSMQSSASAVGEYKFYLEQVSGKDLLEICQEVSGNSVSLFWRPVNGDVDPENYTVVSGSTVTYDSAANLLRATLSGLSEGEHQIDATYSGALYQTASAVTTRVFTHPGILHTEEELDAMKEHVANQEEPWHSDYEKLLNTVPWGISSSSYTADALKGVGRGTPAGSGHIENWERSANAAYFNALQWVITGETEFADAAVGILNAWGNTLEIVDGRDRILGAAISGYKFACAAEIIKHYKGGYDGYLDSDFKEFQDMMQNVVYPVIQDLGAPMIANGNWDTAALVCMISIGILCESPDIYDRAKELYSDIHVNGSISAYVSETGQNQETGRDQAHAQLGIGYMAETCQAAFNQGDDLYSLYDNRLAKAFEYTAKYNLFEDVPFETVNNVFRDTSRQYYTFFDSDTLNRGELRPIYETPLAHYSKLGTDMTWTRKAAEAMRAQGYVHNDNLNFGTLISAIDSSSITGYFQLRTRLEPLYQRKWVTVDGVRKAETVNSYFAPDSDGKLTTSAQRDTAPFYQISSNKDGTYSIRDVATGLYLSVGEDSASNVIQASAPSIGPSEKFVFVSNGVGSNLLASPAFGNRLVYQEVSGSGLASVYSLKLGDETWPNGDLMNMNYRFAFMYNTADKAGAIPPSIETETLPGGTVGVSYSAAVTASGAASISFKTTTGALPDGLSLDPSGLISGIPEKDGTFSFSITAENSSGSDAKEYEIIIAKAPESPEIKTLALPDGIINVPYSAQISTSGDALITFAVTSGLLPDGLILDECVISGIPESEGTFKFSVTASNSTGTDEQEYEIIIAKAPEAPKLETITLPGGTAGFEYAAAIAASGDAPIDFSLASGSLPDGLSLDPLTGIISGVPTAAGAFSFSILASNQAGSDLQDYAIAIGLVPQPPQIETAELPDGTLGIYYSADISASGNAPISYSIAGLLPDGLDIATSSGLISGTPTASGEFSFSVSAINDFGVDEKPFVLFVNEAPVPPTIIAESLLDGTVGIAYSQTITASGDEPISFTVTSGSLPDGLSLASSGEISGTPSKAGDFRFTVTASNADSSDQQEYEISIAKALEKPQIAIEALPGGTVGIAYSQAITASGDEPISFTVSSGSLPDGLSLASTGEISGIPSQSGNFSFSVTAANSVGSDSQDYSIEIVAAPAKPEILTKSLPGGKVGVFYSHIFTASGDEPIVFSISSGTLRLPDGLSLSSSGKISGTPTVAGTFSFAATATNAAGASEKLFSIAIGQASQEAPSYYVPYYYESAPAKPTPKLAYATPVPSSNALAKADTARTAGYIAGYPDGTFRPERNISRYEVAAILFRITSESDIAAAKALQYKGFSDVRADDWYSLAVEHLSKIGVINGYPDGTFRGDKFITQAELSALLFNFTNANLKGSSSRFSKAHWAYSYLLNAENYGLLPKSMPVDDLITCLDLVKAVNKLLGWHIEGADDEREFSLAIEGLKK